MRSQTLLSGLAFPEAPRWRHGRLWFTDQHAHEVVAVDLEGRVERLVSNMKDRPGGLGFLPDGKPVVVAMVSRQVHRIEPSGLELYADLGDLASFHCNDLVVDHRGRAYVGNFGYDVDAGAPIQKAELVLIEPDGAARVVCRELVFPNGSAISPDGRTLLVAETFASRISVFDIEADGSLTNHQIWADLGEGQPDGLCLDAEGAVWFACTKKEVVVRVRAGGEVVQVVEPETPPYACMLGGPDRRTLFILGAETHVPEEAARLRSGRIEVVKVQVPGVGLP